MIYLMNGTSLTKEVFYKKLDTMIEKHIRDFELDSDEAKLYKEIKKRNLKNIQEASISYMSKSEGIFYKDFYIVPTGIYKIYLVLNSLNKRPFEIQLSNAYDLYNAGLRKVKDGD